jgi:LacI family transcriptional regulator
MKRITMKQIAEELGLSRTTVSLVLQQKGDLHRIRKETQQRILDYARNAGYKPDYFASALNSRQSGVIGAIFPDVFESFMGSLIRGMESVLYERGYSLMISTSRFSGEREREHIASMVYRRVDGLILVPTMPYHGNAPYDSSYLMELSVQRFPIVLVDRYLKNLPLPCVLQHDHQLAYNAVETLIQKGHERVVCVSFNLQATSIEDRLRGYHDAMQTHHLPERLVLLSAQDPDSSDLADEVTNLVNSKDYPDAFLVTTTGLADKLNWILARLGQHLPIVRFGTASPWVSHPDIRDIAQPHTEMGRNAAELLLELISSPYKVGSDPTTILC